MEILSPLFNNGKMVLVNLDATPSDFPKSYLEISLFVMLIGIHM